MAVISTKDIQKNNECSDFRAEFMELALKQAEIGKKSNEVPVGCVIVENNKRIIASSHNQTNIARNATKHCEIVCIQQLASQKQIYELSNCYLYVTVEPCIMCASALKIVKINVEQQLSDIYHNISPPIFHLYLVFPTNENDTTGEYIE